MDKALTLLAEGARFALIGDRQGAIFRITALAVGAIRDTLDSPVLYPCPPPNAPLVGSQKAVVDRSLPAHIVLRFRYFTDKVSRITIYTVFCEYNKRWFLRELRDATGLPTGNYHSEGGA